MSRMRYPPPKGKSEMPGFDQMFQNKKVVFLDLDGTIYMGETLIPGAREFLD